MRRSTHYFRDKIRSYRQHSRSSLSPDQSRGRDPTSPAQSIDEQFSSMGLSDIDRESSVAPSEHLDESFVSYASTQKDLSSSSLNRSPEKTPRSNSNWSASHHTVRSKLSPVTTSPLTASSESLTVQNLRKLSAQDAER